jgi:four helix bundle protein
MDNTILLKSKKFAVRIIKCYKYLNDQKHEHIISKQLIRCGTSIGANAIESRNAQSRSDFTSKLNIALKEADETAYWLDLLHSSDYLDDNMFSSLNNDCQELISILMSIIKSLKKKEN